MNLKELRQKYPDYNDMSDEQFAQAFHRKFYSDMDFKDFSTKIGYTKQIDQKEVLKKQGSSAVGVGETALAFLTGGLAQPIAGLAGLGASVFQGGEKGGQTVRDIQEALTYTPRGEEGKRYTENVSDVFAAPIKGAGYVGEAIGGNLGRTIGEAGTELAMNLLPFGIPKAARMAGSRSKGPIQQAPASKLAELDKLTTAPVEPVPAENYRKSMAEKIADNETVAALESALAPEIVVDSKGQATRAADFDNPYFERDRARYDPAPNPLETARQNELFDQPEQGLVSNPYAANMGEWRVDENGMPIRADLSMELQNLQNPLQRNLWGDELQPRVDPIGQSADLFDSQRQFNEQGVQGGIPLTQAMDSMEPNAMRAAVEQTQMGRELPQSPELAAAMLQNDGMRIPQSQRGAINTDIFDYAFRKALKWGTNTVNIQGTPDGPAIEIRSPEGGEIGVMYTRKNETKGEPMVEVSRVYVDPAYRKQGFAEGMYKMLGALGNDIVRSPDQLPGGKAMWDRFEERGFSSDGVIKRSYIPRSQRGAIDLGNATENSSQKKRIALLAPDSPEVIEAKNQLALDNRKAILAKTTGIGIEGYRGNIDTPEKVLAAAPNAKDITKAQRIRGETVSPGINSLVINTNNPLLKFVREKTRSVFLESEALARRYITDKDTGIGTVLNKMTQAEKNDMIEVLQHGDSKQQFITREQMSKAGYSEKVITAVEKFYEMDRKKLEVWNEARAKVGMEPVKERAGHFPGVFKGDYKQIVTVDNKVVGVIAVDTVVQAKKAKAKLLEQFPNAKFTTLDRRALGGNGRKSDMFSGMNDMLTMLAKNDPEFAKVQELIQTAVKENADALYGAAFHSMAKKGVVGNQGNKPWLDRNTNTNEAIKAYLEYWEEGVISHKNLAVESEIKGLMDNPALDHMENAKEYANSYIKNMTGRDIGTIGDAFNKLIDAPFKATGLGPSIPREVINQLNKRLGQHVMGWFNWMFGAIQYLQMPQMALPEMIKVARDLDIPIGTELSTVMTRALTDLTKEKLSGTGSPLMKEAIVEAEKRGLGVFSEYQDVNKVTQNKYSRMYDDVVDFNRALPERQTRPLVFYTFVKMLENSDLPKKDIFNIAYNATQRSMVDYSPRERPMMYQRMGVVGQLAGSLQTFKHAQLSQLASFATKGDITAFATASLVLLALTGIKGAPAYQELDQLYQYLSDKLFGDRRTIADTVLSDLPEWVKSGAASVATDVNVQGRFSAANVVPDTPLEAIMPLGSVLGRQAEATWNLATKQDPLSVNEFLRNMAPSGPIKGMVETTFNVNEDGTPIDKKGLMGDPRTEWDTAVKRSGAGTSLPEALRSESQWHQMQRERANKDAQKSIMEKANRAAAQGILTPELQTELMNKYIARKGDPQQFVNSMVEYQKLLKQNKQQRLEGIPNGSLPSIYRYQNYQGQ